jgi:ATP-dependent exoDNAse (exonuclease V) alpha subunit
MPYSMRRMLHERGSLVACQEQAESEIQRFEQRLLELHTPLNERLKAYEGRIADLERQLASRTEENRELLRAAIDTTRRKLEVERQTRSVSAN